jgi:hypothetical protein
MSGVGALGVAMIARDAIAREACLKTADRRSVERVDGTTTRGPEAGCRVRRAMPNGHDKNFRRLVAACAAYRKRFGEWPAEARMEPGLLWDLTRLFDHEAFQTLSSRLTLKTKDKNGLSVGGSRGVQVYDGSDWEFAGEEIVALTERWLGVEPMREEHGRS